MLIIEEEIGLSVIIYSDPKWYDFLSYVENKRRSLAECPGCSFPYNDSDVYGIQSVYY